MNKKELEEYYLSDLYRYYGNTSKKTFIKQLLLRPGFKYMYVFRKCQYYKGKKFFLPQYLFYRYLLRKYMYKFGYEIPYTTKIGKGLYLGHVGSVVINPKAVIGKNVNIAQGVTIGQTNRGKMAGAPIIGDKVWIGPNSVIVGKITIGNNVLIAAGAYVNFDVPDNSVVIGNPGSITSSEIAAENYCINLVS